MKCLIAVVLFIFSGIFFTLSAQYTIMGQDHPGIQWRQIKTDKFRLVYDKDFEAEAQRAAALLDYTLTLTGNTLNQPHRKLNILLHNRNAVSNGFVTLAPARMEWYSTPPQDMYGQDWLEQLAIHEGRHWSQLNRLKRANVSLLRYAFGEIGWSIGIAQAHPWFLEGDAVVTETALSSSGRGRLPSFEMGFRTIQLTFHRPYPFRKCVFGAYDDYVPNHYELGYLMVAYNRLKYGPELWENVLDDIGYNPFLAPFNISLKKQTGLNREKLYQQTFRELDSLWSEKIKDVKYTPYTVTLPIPPVTYTVYRSPQCYENKIVALKSGLDHAPRIIIYDPKNNRENLLLRTGNIPSDRFTIYHDIIYYDEYQTHSRWGNEVYSVIKAYNIHSGQILQLTHKSRYFAPAPSPMGDYLAVVENDKYGKNYLTLLNNTTGAVMQRYPTPDNAAIQLPSWSSDGKKIVCTLVDTAGKNLMILSTTDGTWQKLLSTKSYDISYPVFAQQYILFKATYSGIDNIFAFDTTTQKVYQLTSARFGAFDPCFDTVSNKLFYCNYDFRGYEIVNMPLTKLAWIPLDKVKDVSLNLADALQQQEPMKFDRKNIVKKSYESTPYRRWQNAIHIHSWIPFYLYTPKNSLQSPKIFPGYYIMSQNLLSTLVIVGGQGYYNKSLYNQLEINYMGHIPVVQLGIQQGDTIQRINLQNESFREKEFKFYTGISLPLNYSSGARLLAISPKVTYEYTNAYYRTENAIKQGQNTFYFSFSMTGYRRMAPRDFVPQVGIVWDLLVAQPLTGQSYFATQLATRTSIFLPGLWQHHAFNFIMAYETQNNKPYRYNTRLDPPRGYVAIWDSIQPYLKNVQQYSVDYYFPLSYGSFTALKVFYFKLFAGSLFFSTAVTDEYQPQFRTYWRNHYTAIGYQLFTDFHLFFFPVTLRLGYNYSLLTGKNKTIVEPYLRVNYSF